jgi:hypothetical protein
MTEARTFKVKTNLSKQVSCPGGRTISSAVARATAALDGHRDKAMQTVEETVCSLEEICGSQPVGSERRVYDLATVLLDLSGFFDTGPLYPAAYSLCEISDRMLDAEAWDWPSVEVHVRALRFVLADGCRSGGMAETILAGLRSVTERMRRPGD